MFDFMPRFGSVLTKRRPRRGGKPRPSRQRAILAPELLEDRVTPSGIPLAEIPIGPAAAGLAGLVPETPGASGTGTEIGFTFHAAAPSRLTLRRDGPDLQIVDTQTEGELARRPLDGTSEVVISGIDLGDDTLTIDLHGGTIPIPITFHGGDAGFDTLNIDGGQFHRSTYLATGPDSGSIALDAMVIHYTGLEPITDTTIVDDRVFDDTTTGNQTIRLIDDGDPANGFVTIDSNGTGGFEGLTFRNPTNSLTINAWDGNDTIIIGALDQGFAPAVTINGGSGDDNLFVLASAAFDGLYFGGDGLDSFVNQGSRLPRSLVSVEQAIRMTPEGIGVDLTATVSLPGVTLSLGGLELSGDFVFALSSGQTTLLFTNVRVDLPGSQGPLVSLTDVHGTFTIVEDDPATSTPGGVYGVAGGRAALAIPGVHLTAGNLALRLNTTTLAQPFDVDGDGAIVPGEELASGLVAVAGGGVTLTFGDADGLDLRGDFRFTKAGDEVEVGFRDVRLDVGGVVNLTGVTGTLTASPDGLHGATSGAAALTLPGVLLASSSLELRINTTASDQAVGSLSLPAHSVAVAGAGVTLTLGTSHPVELNGDFSFQKSPDAVTVTFTDVRLDLGGVVTLSGITGNFTALAGIGLYGSVFAPVSLSLPGVALAADRLALRINTTPATRTVDPDNDPQTNNDLTLPGDSVAVAGAGVSLTVLGQTLTGDFSFRRTPEAVTVAFAHVGLSLGGVVNLSEVAGDFTALAGGGL